MAYRDPHQAGEPPRPAKDRLYVGQLIEHGRSTHEFHPKGPPSYYIKLKTENGVQTLWGKGLERAFSESKTKPKLDDIVGVRENNLDPVSIVTRKEVDGVVVATRQLDTPRPHWVVEKLEENIDSIRRKIEPNPARPTLLESVYGLGYRFNE